LRSAGSDNRLLISSWLGSRRPGAPFGIGAWRKKRKVLTCWSGDKDIDFECFCQKN
jgi:hypothetical protein